MYEPNELLPFDCPDAARPALEESQRRAEIRIAGEQLARLRRDAEARRRKRIYTGVIGGRRAWRGMPVVLQRGLIGNVFLARQGIAVVNWTDPFNINPNRVGYFRVGDLTRFKLPAAALLGSQKRGIKERPSARKARAVRRNGSAPPRPGSRPRGRPRRQPDAAPGQTPSAETRKTTGP